MSRLLITARDYLADYFMCHDDADLLRVLDDKYHIIEGILEYNWWVTLDVKEVCPVDIYIRDEHWALHDFPAAQAVAYQQLGYDVTVALHYARRKQPLEHASLPPLAFWTEGQKQPRLLPLEKLYLHPHRAGDIYERLGSLLGMLIARDGKIISKRTVERAKAAHDREFVLWGPGTQRHGEPEAAVLGGRCSIFSQPNLIRWD